MRALRILAGLIAAGGLIGAGLAMLGNPIGEGVGIEAVLYLTMATMGAAVALRVL